MSEPDSSLQKQQDAAQKHVPVEQSVVSDEDWIKSEEGQKALNEARDQARTAVNRLEMRNERLMALVQHRFG